MTVIQSLPSGFTLGADPELFVFNGEQPVSAHDLIPGTKVKPFPVPGGAIQVDGTAAEFNINPSKTFEEFNTNIDLVLENLQAHLPEGHVLKAVPVVTWSEEYFLRLPYVAKELGCQPDFNAWTGRPNPKPRLKEIPTLRTAAGHIHIGWTDSGSMQDIAHVRAAQHMAHLMDWHVGSWSCDVDTDTTRRLLYGKAGACRYKTYGVEYRTLSNFWVLTPELRLEVWNRTAEACWDMADYLAAEQPETLRFDSKAEEIVEIVSRINGTSEVANVSN